MHRRIYLIQRGTINEGFAPNMRLSDTVKIHYMGAREPTHTMRIQF